MFGGLPSAFHRHPFIASSQHLSNSHFTPRQHAPTANYGCLGIRKSVIVYAGAVTVKVLPTSGMAVAATALPLESRETKTGLKLGKRPVRIG